jgi:hypothetical protein
VRRSALLTISLLGLLANHSWGQVRVPFSVTDSLTKYADTGSITLQTTDSISGELTIGQVDSITFGIWTPSFSDSLFVVYQRRDGQWVFTDKVPYEADAARNITQADYNGDGLPDIGVSFPEGKSGNLNSSVLLFSSVDRRLHYNPAYSLYNVAYRAQTKQVISGWFGGVHDCMSKEAYRISGDSLILAQRVEYCASDDLRRATLQLYSGKRLVRTITGPVGIIHRRFERAVWDSRRWPR